MYALAYMASERFVLYYLPIDLKYYDSHQAAIRHVRQAAQRDVESINNSNS